ncbi:unnamed protein product [Rhodiola kirilowii]
MSFPSWMSCFHMFPVHILSDSSDDKGFSHVFIVTATERKVLGIDLMVGKWIIT